MALLDYTQPGGAVACTVTIALIEVSDHEPGCFAVSGLLLIKLVFANFAVVKFRLPKPIQYSHAMMKNSSSSPE
jgi:hypothetical protein